MKPKVALMMIVAAGDDSEAVNISRALGSVNGYVDEIYVQLNAPKGKKVSPKIRTICEQFANKIYDFTWENNFVSARNDIMSKVPKKYDWLMWMDSDDIIDNPENIRPSLAIMPEDVHGVYIYYDYQKDEHGNVIVGHWATRAVRNDNSFTWKSSIDDDEVSVHETLVPRRSVRSVGNDEWKVIHQAEPGHYKDSLMRNIELLEGMALRQSKNANGIDPRILFYLGSHYFEAYNFRRAKDMFYEYLKLSGWAEERSEAHVYMGKILKMEGKLSGARTAFLMALGENPENPGAYLELGKIDIKEKRYKTASQWLQKGIAIKREVTPMVQYNNDFELYTLQAEALANLGGEKLPEALEMTEEALKLRPYDEDAKLNRDSIQKVADHREVLQGTAKLLNLIKEEDENRIPAFLETLPKTLEDSPVVVKARQTYVKSTKWPKKSIAIYAGQGPLGEWGPWSLKDGIGGSEEAIIKLSDELANLGWDVTVFATPGTKAGEYMGTNLMGENETAIYLDGKLIKHPVKWKHLWEINNKDEFDVLISWRQPAFFDFDWKARKRYLWLHDVMEKEELIPERLKNIDKVIYVSKYHANRKESEQIANIQKFPSGNGINPADFKKYNGKFKRDPHRMIYMSANERGLRILYDIWPDVKKAVPDATLDIYYGWDSFDAVNRDNPERMAWKASMQLKAKELKGVTDHGRIGQDDLNKEIFKSGIFAYPCIFPEVNCITAQKAMAGGAIPVTSDYAVLDDIIQYGTKVPLGEDIEDFKERYKNSLIHMLKYAGIQNATRPEMMKWAWEKFDWKKTAEQWDGEMK